MNDFDRKRQDEKGVWVAKGDILEPVEGMETDRFVNLCRWLVKWAKANHRAGLDAAWSVLGILQGEMAIDQCESDIQRMEEDEPPDTLASHAIFKSCWKRIEEKKELPQDVYEFWESASNSDYIWMEL